MKRAVDWRERRRAKERLRKAFARKSVPSRFDTGRFVAIDGEGFADGELISVDIEDRHYEGHNHFYGLLMDSDGNSIEAPSGDRLTTKECLDFLLDISARDKTAHVVCFGGSYDACHMLAFGLSKDEIGELLSKSLTRRASVDCTLSARGTGDNADGGRADYRIEYRPRKSLTIWRFRHGADKYREHVRRDGRREWKLDPEARVVLWDVWGFFQGSFLNALDNWLPNDPDYAFVKRMKAGRSTFQRSDMPEIRHYTSIELRCLVTMMERVREAIRTLGLTISRWDGGGAIAGAMFKKHDVKQHMAKSPDDVFTAARHAYAGGHIEAFKMGFHKGKVYHYDVNSAYPHQFRKLPSLLHGRWETGSGAIPSSDFTLIRVEFHFLPGRAFYPLFHRRPDGTILYPDRGSGWYWRSEYEAGKRYADSLGAYTFNAVEWHTFVIDAVRTNHRPFSWIEDMYEQRKQLVAESKVSGIPNGAEKTIKLGLNSCYGKTAQQVGARYNKGELTPPAYFQLEWAGYVTAGCRAQLMLAAMQNPEAIISFATDALFSTSPLDLHCPSEKQLGAWEASEHDGITIIMPGVYWLHDGDDIKHYSRGFDKETMSDPQLVHKAWSEGRLEINVTQTRMITLGVAHMSENFWKLRGIFVSAPRALKVSGENSKREAIDVMRLAPHKELICTRPRELPEGVDVPLSALMSEPFKIKFLPTAEETDFTDIGAQSFFLQSQEAADAFFV